mgnify:FL=1
MDEAHNNIVELSQSISFGLHQLSFEKPEDGFEGEQDWNANREKEGNVDCIFLVLGEVEERQEGFVKEGILSQLESFLRGFKAPE